MPSRLTLLPVSAALLVVALLLRPPAPVDSQEAIALGVDMRASDNGARELGFMEACAEVQVGDTFQLDLYVTGVRELKGFELHFGVDPSVLEVVDQDLALFLASAPGSQVKTQVDRFTLYGEPYIFLGAGDIRDAPESGSGVLARLTLTAKAPGSSPTTILYADVDGDGTMDVGPRLTSASSQTLGDTDSDGVFDGPVTEGVVAVGQSCTAAPSGPEQPRGSSTPTAGGSSSSSGGPSDQQPQPGEDDDLVVSSPQASALNDSIPPSSSQNGSSSEPNGADSGPGEAGGATPAGEVRESVQEGGDSGLPIWPPVLGVAAVMLVAGSLLIFLSRTGPW